MKLLQSQKNELFHIIEASGLSPAQFELIEQNRASVREIGFTNIVYKESSWYFSFTEAYIKYSPDKETIASMYVNKEWDHRISFFYTWIDCLKREISSEDLWGRLQSEIKDINLPFHEDNSRFTVLEYDQLGDRLNVLKEKIDHMKLEPQSTLVINQKLDEILVHAKSMSKSNWKSLFIGTIISLVIQLSIDKQLGEQLWDAIREVFSTLFIMP